MIFNELRKHGRLAAKRHPMYEKNKFGKFFMYIGVLFWAGYLIFFGTTFAFMFQDMVPNREPYHVMNGGALIIILILDFIIRFPFQNTPTQEIKPYLLLPVKRNRLIDFLLIRSGLSSFNLFWECMFLPFAIITVTKYFGIGGVIGYCFGIWLLIVANNYWYLLCRTLINERLWWIFLPIAVYSGIIAALIIPENSPLFYFLMDLGDAYITGNVLAYAGTLLVIAIFWLINRKIMAGLIYAEINKVEDTKVKHVSEFRFFEKYGEVGEYMRLEIKMMLRNRRCKGALRSVGLCVVLFSVLLSFSSVYDGGVMNTFVTLYSFMAFGMVILSQIMGFEGNYIDGLMSRKESIMSLLKAKYYIYCLVEIIPLILMIPAFIMGKLTLLNAFAWVLFTTGPIYFTFFQLAVYNKQTVPLNEKLTGRQSTNGLQTIINLLAFTLPMITYVGLKSLAGEVITQCIMLVIGLAFTLTSGLWIKNVYQRFMKLRYLNMEGFRDSRQ